MTVKPPILDPDERIFTLSDVVRLFKRQRKRLLKAIWIGAVFVFSFTVIKAPKYPIEASFKEGMEKSDSSLKDFLGGVGGVQQPQAVSLMKSYQVLKPLVEKLGMQATVPNSHWRIVKLWRRIKENFLAEFQKPLEDLDPFIFKDVVYEGENSLCWTLRFIDAEQFSLFEPGQKKEITKGRLGVEVHFPEVRFTLVKTPKSLRIGSNYPLQIQPWIPVTKKLRNQLQIESNKSNKSVYDLAIYQRDRYLGVRILNDLMVEYQRYLKEDHDELANAQLLYLEQRQDQLFGKMNGMLDEHTAYLNRNLEANGFIGMMEESRSLLDPHQEMGSRVLQIETDLSRLDQIDPEKLSVILGERSYNTDLKGVIEEIQKLRQQRDLLELSLHQPFPDRENQIESRRRELQEVRDKRGEIKNLIETLDQEEEIPLSSFGFNQALFVWAEKISNSQSSDEREDLADYLENYHRILSLRENMLQERFFYGNEIPSEFEGIDLETARTLFLQYNGKLDGAEATMRHLTQLKEEIHSNSFEIGSLSAVLQDPLSESLIKQANDVMIKLKDEKYHSEKEGERWHTELDLQRKILSDHLDQLLKVEELKGTLVREKIASLQQISLDCINQQLSVAQGQLNNLISSLRLAFLEDKKLLEQKMEQLRKQAGVLPEKWRHEKWLELRSGLNLKLIEALTEVVESKTVSHHLHHVESKPLDLAILPTLPLKPNLFRMAFLGAFLAGFATFFLALLQSILKGFPTSPEKLRALGLPYIGTISSFCDGPSMEKVNGPDLELLRQLSLFIEKGKVVGLIGGRGPDYSFAFAENLARISNKSIVLRCDFGAKFQEKDLPGLLQIWKKEIGELPIRKGKSFDWITSGGYSPFGMEIIQSPAFEQLVEVLKKNYDTVFLFTRSPLSNAESKAVLELCDQAIVTVSGEQTEALTPFADWAYHEGNCRLTFITSIS